jgi:hypothetical protein
MKSVQGSSSLNSPRADILVGLKSCKNHVLVLVLVPTSYYTHCYGRYAGMNLDSTSTSLCPDGTAEHGLYCIWQSTALKVVL